MSPETSNTSADKGTASSHPLFSPAHCDKTAQSAGLGASIAIAPYRNVGNVCPGD